MKFEFYFVTGVFFAWHNYLFPNNARVQICPYFDAWNYMRGDVVLSGKYTPIPSHSYNLDDDVPNEVKIALDDLFKEML